MPEYGTHERAALFVLALENREIPNPELVHDYKVKLGPANRERLNTAGLLNTEKSGRRYVHKITAEGIDWCETELASVETPSRLDPLARVMFDVVRKMIKHLRRNNIKLIDILRPADTTEPVDLESLIRGAYRELSEMPEDWVRLARLRPKLNGADRAEVDKALVAMVKAGGVHLVPDSNRKALTADDHAAAIRIGSEDKHLLAIDAS